jgi:hypothetical protein
LKTPAWFSYLSWFSYIFQRTGPSGEGENHPTAIKNSTWIRFLHLWVPNDIKRELGATSLTHSFPMYISWRFNLPHNWRQFGAILNTYVEIKRKFRVIDGLG